MVVVDWNLSREKRKRGGRNKSVTANTPAVQCECDRCQGLEAIHVISNFNTHHAGRITANCQNGI